KSSSDLRVAAVNCILDDGRGLNDSIKHNGEPMMHVCRRDIAELLGAFSVEPQMDDPAFFFIGSARAGNAITGSIGFLFYQQPFFDRFFAFTLHLIRYAALLRRKELVY